jgi:hypothetical protein
VREDALIAKLRDMIKSEWDEDLIAAYEITIAQLERQAWMRGSPSAAAGVETETVQGPSSASDLR